MQSQQIEEGECGVPRRPWPPPPERRTPRMRRPVPHWGPKPQPNRTQHRGIGTTQMARRDPHGLQLLISHSRCRHRGPTRTSLLGWTRGGAPVFKHGLHFPMLQPKDWVSTASCVSGGKRESFTEPPMFISPLCPLPRPATGSVRRRRIQSAAPPIGPRRRPRRYHRSGGLRARTRGVPALVPVPEFLLCHTLHMFAIHPCMLEFLGCVSLVVVHCFYSASLLGWSLRRLRIHCRCH